MGFMPTGTQRVRVRFYDGAGSHLEETPISVTQTLTVQKNGVADLVATLPVTEQFKWWLLGFGDRVEVLAPAALRKEIHRRLSAAEKRYRKATSI